MMLEGELVSFQVSHLTGSLSSAMMVSNVSVVLTAATSGVAPVW